MATLPPARHFARVLTICVLSYITNSSLLIIPNVILVTVGRTTQALVPQVGVVITSITSGLVGTPNAALFSMGPSIPVVFIPQLAKKRSSYGAEL